MEFMCVLIVIGIIGIIAWVSYLIESKVSSKDIIDDLSNNVIRDLEGENRLVSKRFVERLVIKEISELKDLVDIHSKHLIALEKPKKIVKKKVIKKKRRK